MPKRDTLQMWSVGSSFPFTRIAQSGPQSVHLRHKSSSTPGEHAHQAPSSCATPAVWGYPRSSSRSRSEELSSAEPHRRLTVDSRRGLHPRSAISFLRSSLHGGFLLSDSLGGVSSGSGRARSLETQGGRDGAVPPPFTSST